MSEKDFVMPVDAMFHPQGSNDCMLAGNVSGMVHVLDRVRIAKDASCELRRIDFLRDLSPSDVFADLFWKRGVAAVQAINGQTQLDIRRLITAS